MTELHFWVNYPFKNWYEILDIRVFPRDLRWESVVLTFTADAFAVLAITSLVVEVQLVESISKGKQHQAVDEEELQDVQKHPS